MGRKIVVAMINIAVGLFTAYMFILSDRKLKSLQHKAISLVR